MTKAPSSKTKFAHLTDDLGLSQMKCKIECVLPKTIGNDGDDDVSGKSFDTGKYYENIFVFVFIKYFVILYILR